MLYLLLLLLLAAFAIGYSIKKKNAPFLPSIEPDSPIGFGYKNEWLAVRCTDEAKIVDLVQLLRLEEVQASNWASGMEGVQRGYAFVSPIIDGWVLIQGLDLGDISSEDVRELLVKISFQFGECQHFITHRVTEYHSWAKVINGRFERVYAFVGSEGENIEITGLPTPVEQPYKFINTFLPEAQEEAYWESPDLTYPDESLVMEIAEAWSINPCNLGDRKDIKTLGLIGKFKLI